MKPTDHGPEPDAQTTDAASTPAASADGLQQRQIGRYRLERVLGEGGFGRVFLAHDAELGRYVAIKVPRLQSSPGYHDAYLAEARVLASLDHPSIVPVHDVGVTAEGTCYVVSKVIEGCDLAATMQHRRLSVAEAAELAARVGAALHYAHRRGLVHRDIKPANILIDADGQPYLTDFGLALKEQDFGKGTTFAGTPAYMSPEQARGEGHRVDGRSDIFSLGIVLYEMLTARRPFHGDSQAELLEQISNVEARPPRQIEDHIPKELERICLKALAKRASERYTTAKDMADDLFHWCRGHIQAGADASPSPFNASAAGPPPSSQSQRPLKIVPRGLRSFDSHDADFFLELLPGPRDRDGLPDSLRFWKSRIEEFDPDLTFAVGLIYGPSGCGKSSLMKAGLLPLLSPAILAVYIEATPEETEARLLGGLCKCCPQLPPDLGLKDTLAALRRGHGVGAGQKVLIVVDQFEQWLHAQREQENTELVQALRQCDGGRVQCIVMVRDDFWMAATRFMRELEVRLLEGQNSAAVDLFPLQHAQRVLTAFGRAFGTLPEDTRELGQEQKQFVAQATAGLAEDGKIICVRLALFAEMIKGKAWTPASLRELGGTQGVGVTFLEETFSARIAPPEHRYHQQAARAVLKALLPEAGADIRGHMRSFDELLAASGYASRPRDFADLLRILDTQLRLITPTDPQGMTGDEAPARPEGQAPSQPRFYQLTHDYLVLALRDWLTRKQRETRRGRAALALADRAAVWRTRPENRQLPPLWQWLSIRLLTSRKNWTPAERHMMRAAGRMHTLRGCAVVAALVLAGLVGWEAYGRLKAQALRDRLLEGTTSEVPAIIDEMSAYRRWLDPLLYQAGAEGHYVDDPRKSLHLSLALLPVEPGHSDYLHARLLDADPPEVRVIGAALAQQGQQRTERLWTFLEDTGNDPDQRLRAACALAIYDPHNRRWGEISTDVAGRLLAQDQFAIAAWTELLHSVRRFLLPPLAAFLESEERSWSERGLIARIYGKYGQDQPDAFARLERMVTEPPDAGPNLLARHERTKKQAKVALALLIMGRGATVWPLLRHRSDPELRSFLIEWLGPAEIDARVVQSRLLVETDVSARRALLLSLGEYGLSRLPVSERQELIPRLVGLYGDDPDPGIHAAAEWLLRQWQAAEQLKALDEQLAARGPQQNRRWYLTPHAHTMVMVSPPSEFWMGDAGERHRRRIGRNYAIAAREVTFEQYLAFRKDHPFDKTYSITAQCPTNKLAWYDAAAYCNWLSEQEGIPREQWCYEPNPNGQYAAGMKLSTADLTRTGYRLPTEAEWEYACRAGSDAGYSFGETQELLGKYAWFYATALNSNRPVGQLKPNDLGLFDMHGNVWEWLHNALSDYAAFPAGSVIDDREPGPVVMDSEQRMFRGGSFLDFPPSLRSMSCRSHAIPTAVHANVGFRVARTLAP